MDDRTTSGPDNPARWIEDPTGRHELRYWDGGQWTDQVMDSAVAGTDPVSGVSDPEPAVISEATEATTAGSPTQDSGGDADATVAAASVDSEGAVESPQSHDATEQNEPVAPVAATGVFAGAAIADVVEPEPAVRAPRRLKVWHAVVIGVVALIVGVVAGAASQQSEINDQKDTISALEGNEKQLTKQRNSLQEQVDDREAQRRADEAEARRLEAERQAAADKAAEEARKKAEAQAAAEAKAAADAAAAAAKRDKVPGDGVREVGREINAGRWSRDGTGSSCYYAVLNSPDTFDIAYNNITGGPATVDLRDGQFFNTKGCGSWTRVG